MKKIYLFAAATLALASCTDSEYLGGQKEKLSETINFAPLSQKTTRAGAEFEGSQAAAKLNSNFIVYGFKTSAAEAVDGTTDQAVFDRYNVNYEEGTANTTESNTAGWEYVGLKSFTEVNQTIKYWDYSATSYVFSAVSGTGITPVKIEKVVAGTVVDAPVAWNESTKTLTTENQKAADIHDKGWVVTIPQGGSISDCYVSERVPVAKADYKKTVKLKFYSMGAKVRFGIYEIIPGYEVHIEKFYYTDGSEKNSETNFAVDGNFTTLKTDADSKVIVTYYPSGTLENHPKVSPLNGSVNSAAYGEFGTNIQATRAIGTTSFEATYDQSEKESTDIIPMTGNGLDLKVDYTLTSTDGSGEKITVHGATAKVPANFTDWKANFAYTYLFKINDNTNGKTDPDDSDPDHAGLYPITFDACVVATEDGIQETITSVSNPSITTYQNGEIVTKNNEYVAGNIYFEEAGNADISGYKVYEVNNYTGNPFETQANMTEEVVANYLKNFCVLTEVTTTDVSAVTPNPGIPLSDGTYMTKPAKMAYVFNAVAGKTYVIANNEAASATQWKLVKVAEGPAAAVSYTLYTDALAGTATTLNLGGFDPSDNAYATTGNLYLAGNSVGVIGAMPLFTVTPDVVGNNGLVIDNGSSAGVYNLSINSAAVNAGTAKGNYTVKFNNGATVTITIGTTNKLWDNAATPLSAAAVTAGGSAVTTVLKIDNVASNTGVIVNNYEDKGVRVTNTSSNGEYTISATQDAKPGVYNVTIAGETVAVTVTNYAFAETSYHYTLTTGDALIAATGTPATIVLNVLAGNAAAASTVAAASVGVTGANLTLTGTGTFTPSAVYSAAGGDHTLTYSTTAAKANVTIDKYTITGGSIAISTGSLELAVKINDKDVLAYSSRVKITDDDDSNTDVTAKFNVGTNGKKILLTGAKSTLVKTHHYTVHYYLENGKTNEVATSALTVN